MGKIMLGFTDAKKKETAERIMRGGTLLIAIGSLISFYGMNKRDKSETWYKGIDERSDNNIIALQTDIEKNIEKRES